MTISSTYSISYTCSIATCPGKLMIDNDKQKGNWNINWIEGSTSVVHLTVRGFPI